MKRKPIMIIITVIFGLLLVGGSIVAYFYFRPPTAQELERYEQAIQEGNLFYEGREFTQAIKKYNSAIKILHREPQAYSNILQIYLDKHDFNSAKDFVKKASNYLSGLNTGLLYSQLARAYYDSFDFENAKKYYELAISLNSAPDISLGLAKVYLQTGDFSKARDLLGNEFNENSFDEANLLYAYVLSLQDVTQAKEHLESISPSEEWSVFYNEMLEVISSFDDNELFNTTKLARIFLNNGYPKLSISVLEKYNDGTLDQYIDALFILGKAKLNSQDYDGAIATLTKTTVLIGYEVQKYWMLGRAYYRIGDLVNSILNYDRSISYSNEINRPLITEYLDILIKFNQTTKTEQVLGSVIGEINQPWIYIVAQEVYFKIGNSAKFEYYTQLLSSESLQPNEQKEYLFWTIRYMLEEGNTNEIYGKLEQLFLLDRLNPKYYWLKGILDYENNNFEDSRNNWEKALEYDLGGIATVEVEKLLSRV